MLLYLHVLRELNLIYLILYNGISCLLYVCDLSEIKF